MLMGGDCEHVSRTWESQRPIQADCFSYKMSTDIKEQLCLRLRIHTGDSRELPPKKSYHGYHCPKRTVPYTGVFPGRMTIMSCSPE